jgi:glucokinase
MHVIGLDLGGTKLAGALFNRSGEILVRRTATLEQRGGNDVGALVVAMARELLSIAGRQGSAVSAIGVAVPGIAYGRTGNVWAPNIPGWEEYPLRSELEDAVGPHHQIRVVVDSDRACSILGERWRGAARGNDHAIFVAVGTGIGLGVLVNGEVLRGAHDIAGATGWMALDPVFRDAYAACGCFEYAASGDGLGRVARDFLQTMPQYRGELRQIPPASVTAREVFAAYDRQDPVALRTMDLAIVYWGMATANYVSLFDPDRIIFGGGVFGPAVRFLPAIRKEAEKWAQPISMQKVTIVPAELGADAVLFGAGSLALRARRKPELENE